MNKAYSNKALPPGTVLREWRLEVFLALADLALFIRGAASISTNWLQ